MENNPYQKLDIIDVKCGIFLAFNGTLLAISAILSRDQENVFIQVALDSLFFCTLFSCCLLMIACGLKFFPEAEQKRPKSQEEKLKIDALADKRGNWFAGARALTALSVLLLFGVGIANRVVTGWGPGVCP